MGVLGDLAVTAISLAFLTILGIISGVALPGLFIAALWMKPLPLFGTAPPGLAAAVKFEVRQAAQYPLAKERVRYVGEIVATVVADDRGRAEDAVEALEVEYAPRPVAVDMLTAGEP